MARRVWILLRTRLAASMSVERAPVAALLMQALVASVLCGLARDELGPYAYGLFALTLAGALLAVPLLGELAPLLSIDEADEWVRALPVRPREVHASRVLHLLAALATLALGALLPAAALAPSAMGAPARLVLVLAGLGQAVLLAALLLGVQRVLGSRARPLLVLLQTTLFIGILVGLVLGARLVPGLRAVESADSLFASAPAARALPPAWFAAPLASSSGAATWAGAAAALLSLLALALTPPPAREGDARSEPLLALVLRPARALATRLWLRDDERASFDLVYDGLPKERAFVLRAWPLVLVPLAFLWIGARQADPAAAAGLTSLLCFTTAAYFPLLASHVPASESAAASWILRTAPAARASIDAGAQKAVAVRFALPLYLLLAGLCAARGGALDVLRFALPGFLCAVLVLLGTWRTCVRNLPLSVEPDKLAVNLDWLGLVGGLGMGLLALSIFVARRVETFGSALALAAVLALLVVFSAHGSTVKARPSDRAEP